jgi:cobalt-zinc-cadmium efflux system membrane fusion protein
MKALLLPRLALLAALVAGSGALLADAGHDHGHEHGNAAAAGPASPRLSAQTDLFELVGVVEHGAMTVYLDRYASNEPVTGARIEYEAGEHKGVAQAQPDGSYRIAFDALGMPGQHAFAFTVAAGGETDLLAADLDLRHVHEAAAAPAPRPWPQWLPWAATAAAALGFAVVALRRLRRGARHG